MVMIIHWRLAYFSNSKAIIIVFLCQIVLRSDLFEGIFQTNILIEVDIRFKKVHCWASPRPNKVEPPIRLARPFLQKPLWCYKMQWEAIPVITCRRKEVPLLWCHNKRDEPLTRFRNRLIRAGVRWLKSHCVDTTFPRKPLWCYRNPTEGYSTHDIWNPTWTGWLGKTVIWMTDNYCHCMLNWIWIQMIYKSMF